MIHVNRSKVAKPEILRSALAVASRDRIATLLTKSSKKHLAQLRVSFEMSVWKKCIPDLMNLFNAKCAYCESPLTSQPGDIEHFRPKQGAEDLQGKRQHLHYAWLAYEWENLLISCASCNRRRVIGGQRVGKGALFPVDGRRAAMLASLETCRETEDPLLIDPCYDDPAEHLAFEQSGRVLPKTARGECTINVLGLNLRDSLVEERRHAWLEVQTAFGKLHAAAAENDAQLISDAVSFVRESVSSTRPYLAARRASLQERFESIRQSGGSAIDPGLLNSLEPHAERPFTHQRPTGHAPPANLQSTQKSPASSSPPLPPAPPKAPAEPPRRKLIERSVRPFAYQRIRRIEIRNFKVIESLDLDIPPGPSGEDGIPGALMMLGENATGKSTVLDAVALTLLGCDGIAELGLDGQSFLRREARMDGLEGPKHPASVRLILDDESSELRLDIDLEGKLSGNDIPAVVLLGYGPRRFFSRQARHIDAPAERIKSMFDPLATLANPEEWLLRCSDKHFALAVRGLRALLLLRDEAEVHRIPKDSRRKTHVVFELDGRVELLGNLSEGYKTIVAMGVDIMRELLSHWEDLESAHGIVLIDELDTHLHPRWKMRIAQRLRRALPEVQFLASTHDPLCLRGYHDGEVQVLRRDAEAGVERIPDLPNVRGLSVQQLLTSEFFGLWSAEDPALEEGVARYVTLAAKRDRSPEEEAELARQRSSTDASIQLGATPPERALHQALNEYLTQGQAAPDKPDADIQRATVDKLVGLWKELDARAGVEAYTTPPAGTR